MRASALDQPDFSGARTLPGFFRRELHTLSFTKQLEHGTAYGAAMEEVLDPAFVADEAEPLVDEKPRDRPGWHNPIPRPPAERSGNIPDRSAELETEASVGISRSESQHIHRSRRSTRARSCHAELGQPFQTIRSYVYRRDPAPSCNRLLSFRMSRWFRPL